MESECTTEGMDELNRLLESLESDDHAARATVVLPRCFGKADEYYSDLFLKGGVCPGCDHKVECKESFAALTHDRREGLYLCFGKRQEFGSEKCMGCRHAERCVATETKIKINAMEKKGATKEQSLSVVEDAPYSPIPVEPMIGLMALDVPAAHGKECVTTLRSSKDTGVPSRYRFPNDNLDFQRHLSEYRAKPDDELCAVLNKLTGKITNTTATIYYPYRNDLCAIQIVLNEQGKFGPRFRGVPPGNFAKGGRPATPEDGLLANDKRVIDLHWAGRYCELHPQGSAIGIFTDGGIDYDEASIFVSRMGAAEKKAELLGLSLVDELPLAIIQSKATRDLWKKLRDSKLSAMRRIRDALKRSTVRRKDRAEWLWDVYAAYHLTGRQPLHTRTLLGLMGWPIPEREKLRRALAWLEKSANLSK